MNKKKLKKLTQLIDPEPQECFPNKCGRDEVSSTNTGILVLDAMRIVTFVPILRELTHYHLHDSDCAWRQWAMRELARLNNE